MQKQASSELHEECCGIHVAKYMKKTEEIEYWIAYDLSMQ